MSGDTQHTIIIDGNQLTLEDVAYFAKNTTVKAALSNSAISNITASRQVVENVIASGKVVYGINTGFGAMSSITIASDALEELQINLVRSHAIGTGDTLDITTTRAMMLLRANTLAKGFSGCRVELIQHLLDCVNRGVYPVIPSQGSLGASGDLAPLAHMSLTLVGEGEAIYNGERLDSVVALKRAGLTPITLKAKEGLALLNGTQMMSAIGTLTLLNAEALADLADLAGAATIEAVKGSHKPFDERIAEVRAHKGHAESARIIRQFLAGSKIAESHVNCAKVQDAYSLRCIPQVHGAVRTTLKQVRDVLAVEINSATDNPLVFPNGDIISQGNFHGEPVAIAMDNLSIALAELASISERRIDKLMNPAFSELPAFLTGEERQAGLHSGMMIAHYTAASLVSENKSLAHPASIDSIPTSNDKEDHVSMGATAARKARKILEHTQWVIATELMCACQGLEFHDTLTPGDGVKTAYSFIRSHVKALGKDRYMAPDVNKILATIHNGTLHHSIASYL